MTTPIPDAQLANAAYTGVTRVGSWERIRTSPPSFSTWISRYHPGTGAIVYRGTASARDVLTDYQLARITPGAPLPALIAAGVAYARREVSLFTVIHNIGHSLGGTCALVSAYRVGGTGIAFAPHIPIFMTGFAYTPRMVIRGSAYDVVFTSTLLDRMVRRGAESAHWEVSMAPATPQAAHALTQWLPATPPAAILPLRRAVRRHGATSLRRARRAAQETDPTDPDLVPMRDLRPEGEGPPVPRGAMRATPRTLPEGRAPTGPEV